MSKWKNTKSATKCNHTPRWENQQMNKKDKRSCKQKSKQHVEMKGPKITKTTTMKCEKQKKKKQ